MALHGIPWTSTENQGNLCNVMKFHRNSIDFFEIPWISMEVRGLPFFVEHSGFYGEFGRWSCSGFAGTWFCIGVGLQSSHKSGFTITGLLLRTWKNRGPEPL